MLTYVTCYHKMSVKSPVCIQRYSLLNMPQNNRKQRKINTKYWFLWDKTRSYTHISYIILKLLLWRIWICRNFEKQLLLLYAHFVIAGHILQKKDFILIILIKLSFLCFMTELERWQCQIHSSESQRNAAWLRMPWRKRLLPILETFTMEGKKQLTMILFWVESCEILS